MKKKVFAVIVAVMLIFSAVSVAYASSAEPRTPVLLREGPTTKAVSVQDAAQTSSTGRPAALNNVDSEASGNDTASIKSAAMQDVTMQDTTTPELGGHEGNEDDGAPSGYSLPNAPENASAEDRTGAEGADAGETAAAETDSGATRDGGTKAITSGTYDTNYKVTTVKSVKSGTVIVGAVLQILDSSGKVVEEWTTTKDDHAINAKLVAGATYTLHEKSVPAGYVLAKDQKFTVSKDGSLNSVEMKDDWTKVTVLKYSNATMKLLPGSTLQVIDPSTNKVIYEWTSDGTATRFEGFLEAGKKYILRETKAPAGHTIAADVTFTVSSDGREDTVTMYDDYTKVSIRKVAK